jgi:tetratricopeptide (TPR) repeat protein
MNIFKNFFHSSSQTEPDNPTATDLNSHPSSSFVLETAESNLEQGNQLWQQGKVEGAIAAYRQAIEIAPNLSEAHEKLAIALQKQGNLPEAMTHYRKAIVLNTSTTETSSKLSASLQATDLKGKSEESTKKLYSSALEAVSQRSSQASEISLPVSGSIVSKPSFDGNESSLAQVQILPSREHQNQTWITAPWSFGLSQKNLGLNSQESLRALSSTSFTSVYAPGNTSVSFYFSTRESPKATTIDQVKKETDVSTRNNFKQVQDSEEKPFALTGGQEAARIYLQQALAFCDEKQWQQAIVACQQALRITPNLAEAYKLWGNALQRMGKTVEAMGYYAKAVAIQPDLAEVYANLGSLYAQQKKWEQAIEYYQKAVAIKPKFAGAYRHLAKVYQELGNSKKAWEYQYIALSLEPDKAKVQDHWLLANQLEKQGQLEKAVVHYRYVVKLNPKFAEAYQKLAEILEKLGHWQEATTYYRHLVDLEQQQQQSQSQVVPASEKNISRLPGKNQEQPLLSTNSLVSIPSPSLKTIAQTRNEANSNNSQPGNKLENLIERYRQKARENRNSAEIKANLGTLYARNQQWQEAIACYRQAITLNPQFAGAYRNLAKVLEKTGKLTEAAEGWYQAFTLEPQRATAKEYWQLGNLFSQQGNLEKAITCYRQGIDRQPKSWELYHHLGDVLTKQEQWEEAIKAYQHAIAINNDFSWSHNNLGNALLHCQKWSEAVQSFLRAIELNPNFPWSHYNLGEALVKLERWEEAIAAYRQGQQLQPDLPEIEQKLDFARHQRIKTDHSKALSCYYQAIEQDPNQLDSYLKILAIEPDNQEISSRLGELLLFGNYLTPKINQNLLQELITCYQQVINVQPNSSKGYLLLAKLMELKGEQQLAYQYREQALQLEPQQATAEEHLDLGDVCRQQGKIEAAIACYRRSLTINPSYAPAYQRLGELLLKTGQEQEALAIYQQALEDLPEEAGLRYQLCQIWTKQQQWTEAIACYRTAAKLQPNHSQAYHHLGDALRQQQLWQEAVAAYHQAIELNPNFTWSYYNLSLALSQLGKWGEVITCHEKITELEPNFWDNNQTDFELHHQLGDLYFQQQKWREAIQAYGQATKLKPDSSWSHYNLGRSLLELERWAEATQSFRQAIQLDPSFGWAYYHLGESLSEQKEWDQAIAAYRQAVELESDIPSFQAKLADALGQRSQLDSHQAINYYQELIKQNPDDITIYHKAIEIQPDNGKLYLQLGNALVRKNQLEQAVLYYQLALHNQPQNGDISLKLEELRQKTGQATANLFSLEQTRSVANHSAKAEAYLQQGKTCLEENQLQQAIIWLQTAIEFNPNYGEAYFQLGNALTNQANLDQALICYRKALELEPENCWFYNGYGDALKGRWDLDEALEAYNRAIQIYPDFEGFYHNRDQVIEIQTRWQRLVDYCQQVLTNQSDKADDSLRILLVTPYPVYPPNTGGAIRMFEQIKYLGSRHHLTVVSFIFEDKDYAIEESLEEYCDFSMMVKLGVPLAPRKVDQQNQIYHWGTWNMWKVLQQLSQIPFDTVLFDFIFSTPYHSLFSDRITILNEHNIESKILEQCAKINESDLAAAAENVEAAKVFLDSARESRLLANYEDKTWPKFTLRTVVSNDDKEELERRCPDCRTMVVKNGIDTHQIVPVHNTHGRKMLYMGTMTYYPNIDAVLYFAEEILPKIRQHDWTIPFCIAGRDPSAEVRALAESHSYVEIVANPKTMSDIARDCSMAVVPIRLGSGTRIKILHAMAMGLPVISTSLGCEGLTVTDGENILIRDTPQEFAEAVLQVSTNPELRQKLGVNGRQLVEREYDWESIFAQYEQEILSLVSQKRQLT